MGYLGSVIRVLGSPVKFAGLLFCEKFNWASRDYNYRKTGCAFRVARYVQTSSKVEGLKEYGAQLKVQFQQVQRLKTIAISISRLFIMVFYSF